MTQSALGGSLKPVPSVDNSAETNYQDALDRIKTALDARERKAFDPVLLAMAQGFLAPTKTGSFGESLGQAAGAVLPVQQQQEKEAMENAQFRLQLAQAEREQANLTAAQRAFGQAAGLGGGAGGAGAAGGAGGEGAAAGGAGDFQPVSLQNAMKFVAAFPNQKELGARMMEAAKAGLDRFAMSMNGIVFDKMTGKYLNVDIPGQTQSDYSTPYGTFKMLPNEYSRFTMAQKAGMGREWMDAFKRGEQFGVDQLVAQKMEGKTPMAPIKKPEEAAKPAEPGGRMTVVEQEAQSAAEKKRAEKTAESEVERTQAAINAAADADSRLNSATVVKSLMDQEGMPQVVGVLEKPGMLPGLLKAAEEGVNAGRGFGLSLPQVRQIYTQNKITLPPVKGESAEQYRAREEAVISRLQQLSSEFARITFGFRSMAKGQGAISNLENNIFQSMGPTIQDTYQTIMAKTAHSAARAEADKKIAEALTDSGMSIDRFRKTDEYKQIQRNYDNQLRSIYGGVQVSGRPVIGKTTTGPVTAEDLRSRLPK